MKSIYASYYHTFGVLLDYLSLRSSLPKHVVTYGPNIALKYMDSLSTNKELLTKKLCIYLAVLLVINKASGKLKTDKSILSHGTCIYFLFQYCFKSKTIRIINTYLCLAHTHKILAKWCIIDWLQEYSSRTDSERKS